MGSCKTCTCACLRRRPTPPTKRNTVRNKKAGDARKASEWITEDVTCSWRNSKRARTLSDLCWRFHLGLGWTRFGGDRSRIWRKEGKKNYCQMLPIVEEDWRSFSYFVSIGRRGMIPSDLWLKISLFWRRGWNKKFGDYLWKNLFHFDWKFNDYDYFAWMKDFLRIWRSWKGKVEMCIDYYWFSDQRSTVFKNYQRNGKILIILALMKRLMLSIMDEKYIFYRNR